jgi:hypothetical protein
LTRACVALLVKAMARVPAAFVKVPITWPDKTTCPVAVFSVRLPVAEKTSCGFAPPRLLRLRVEPA